MPHTYRCNVAALIIKLNKKDELKMLLGERKDFPGCWQWPQGGVDKGETLEEALFREIKEETGLTRLTILHQFSKPIRYEFPKERHRKFASYIGQEQYYFILTIHEEDPGLKDLRKTSNHEFSKLRWRNPKNAVKTAPSFKKRAYAKAFHLFEKYGSSAMKKALRKNGESVASFFENSAIR